MIKGRIIRGVGGFYDIHTPDNIVYRCRAKGIFRKLNMKPLVGDLVDMKVTDEKDLEGSLESIHPRKSQLLRPAVANVDQAVVIFAIKAPSPNLNLLDHFLIHMKKSGLPCIICFNKSDLISSEDEALSDDIRAAYIKAGYKVIYASVNKNEGLSELKECLKGHLTTVAGPSGVGKSSIINLLQPHTVMETGEISRKIERGRHTTRHTELIFVGDESYIMDTPGFTSLRLPVMEPGELSGCYGEFDAYRESCRFNGCSHTHEPDCGVKAAVDVGDVSGLRYNNYCRLYEELVELGRRY